MGFIIIGILLLGLTTFYLLTTMQDLKIKKAEKAVEEGNLDMAMAIFMDSLSKNPKNPEALWHLGNINEEKGNPLEAIGYYTQLIDLGIESKFYTMFELYRRVGLLYRKVERDKEALDYLLQAYQILPSGRNVVDNIASIIMSQEQFFRALPFYERAHSLKQNDAVFLQDYGLCLIMIDNINDAMNVLEEALRIDPSRWQVKFMLSYIYMRIEAYQRAREFMEEVANSDSFVLTKGQMYFAVKLLFLSYIFDKSYEVARELHKQLENMILSESNTSQKDEIDMAFIYLRIQQSYYDLALERLNEFLDTGVDTENMNDEQVKKIKENKSFLFDALSKLDKYKKEQERHALESGSNPRKLDVDFAIIKAEAEDAKKKLDYVFSEWIWKFLNYKTLWKFFGTKPKYKFDPASILDKYTGDNIKAIKEKFKSYKSEAPKKQRAGFKALGINPSNPCESFFNIDFPTFQIVAKELAEVMGYKVVDPTLRIDQVSYSEGQSFDILCETTTPDKSRILFCVRRWREPVGFITIMNLTGALRELEAKKLVLISTSPLSTEAKNMLKHNDNVSFYTCEEITNYLI